MKVWGIMIYFISYLTELLTSNMFSEAPRGQIKKIISFASWFYIYWSGLALFLHAA